METKTDLINKIRTADNQTARAIVDRLREQGWLSDGSLRGISLCHARLQDADLSTADLVNIDFHQAHLDWANLSNADLYLALFRRASLCHANLHKTNLRDVDLYKVDLSGAYNWTHAQFQQCKRLWGATMPAGGIYNGCYNLKGDLSLAQWRNIDINDPQAMADFYGVESKEYVRGQEQKTEIVAV